MTDRSRSEHSPQPLRFERPSALAFLGYALALALVLWSLQGADFSVDRLL
ncbi:MAG TPA: phosphonate ABC transporter, permease protein PhnE, partial [Aliiroseovarius sp.]|nr:phosphonate ABC transporter, permease protein PhnE [Aliiroseovarius sp.]